MNVLNLMMSFFMLQSGASISCDTTAPIQYKTITTSLGDIAVQLKIINKKPPILLLHGVYFDHHLWDCQVDKLTNYSTITIDMPLHGGSKAVKTKGWDLQDCAKMVLEILDQLELPKVIGIGHSWGSMTLLRAADLQPERFQALGFCNMPFKGSTPKIRSKFRFQHIVLGFRTFYTKQVAKALFGEKILKDNPKLLAYLQQSMGKLTAKEIRWTDKIAIIDAEDASQKIRTLKVPTIALKGEEDYVAAPLQLQLLMVKGGHVSPLEAKEDVLAFIFKVIALGEQNDTTRVIK